MMENDVETRQVGEWMVRLREPSGDGPHPVMLLLHGWTGDENVMWIFSARLPKNALLISPRGLHPTPLGGYGWHPHRTEGWPHVDEFRPSIQALLNLITPENFPTADLSTLRLVGFSQGAALTYTFALLYPKLVRSLAGLSGFAPEGVNSLVAGQPLRGKPAFIAHGTQDNIVSVERARQSVGMLEKAGASVTYCEDDVGHKLSADCFRGLQAFFVEN